MRSGGAASSQDPPAGPRAGRRVVVTGVGAVTALGPDSASTWAALLDGRSGIRPITAFDPSRVRSRIAGEAREADPLRVIDRKAMRRTDRCTQLALLATQEALRDAGLPERLEGTLAESSGSIVASGLGGCDTIFTEARTYVEQGPDRMSPFFVPMAIANMAAGQIAMAFGALGPSYALVSACAGGAHAIGEAAETIRRGDAELMLAGGAEAPVVEGIVGGFAAMRALSTRNDDPAGASRPFDADRDGFVVAEGAATLVLEELEHAARRGARIHAELMGYGASADGYHLTLPAPGGGGAVRAARRALAKADLDASQVDHVSAHATSTGEGDAAELAGFRALFGSHAESVSVSAIKGALGHTLGAAGAIAAAMAILTLRDGRIPPTLNLQSPDPRATGLDLTPLVARQREIDVALVNAFGFGGQNGALLLRRWEA